VLAGKVRQLRLQRKWKQSTLAERSGFSLASLRRFERTGLVSLQSLLKISITLGRLGDFNVVFNPPKASRGAFHFCGDFNYSFDSLKITEPELG
jgi:transcriptional regulator with XRE-family HTH domain